MRGANAPSRDAVGRSGSLGPISILAGLSDKNLRCQRLVNSVNSFNFRCCKIFRIGYGRATAYAECLGEVACRK